MSFMKAAVLGLLVFMMVLSWPSRLAAALVPVRFVEGAVHGFLALRTLNGVLVAPGELLQVVRGGEVESRMVFRFKDGSVLDETVVFTRQRVLAMQSYRLVQRGPVFTEDIEIALEHATGKYEVMHRLMARPDVAGIDARGHRLDALPISGQAEPGDIGSQGPMPIPVPEGRGEALNIRVKPLGARGREVGHTPTLPAYPMASLIFLTQ